MIIYPKKDIKNAFGQIVFKEGKQYECGLYPGQNDDYIVKCELIGNEYPTMNINEIRKYFFLIDEMRDNKINDITK